MNAKELRIGNYIHDLNHPKRHASVFRINSGSEWPITYSYGKIFEHTPLHGESLLPIPLTEEWLLKFGFKYAFGGNEKMFICVSHDFYIWSDAQNSFNQCNFIMDKFNQVVIKYVHQLQNLYFALTGEELTLK